jgi:hypothetical protein
MGIWGWLSGNSKENRELERQECQRLRRILDGSQNNLALPRNYTYYRCCLFYCNTPISIESAIEPRTHYARHERTKDNIYLNGRNELYLDYDRFVDRFSEAHGEISLNKTYLPGAVKIAKVGPMGQLYLLNNEKKLNYEGLISIYEKGSWGGPTHKYAIQIYRIDELYPKTDEVYATVEYPAWDLEKVKGSWGERSYHKFHPLVEEPTSIGERLGVLFRLNGEEGLIATGYRIPHRKDNPSYNNQILVEMKDAQFSFFNFVCGLYTASCLYSQHYHPGTGIETPISSIYTPAYGKDGLCFALPKIQK